MVPEPAASGVHAVHVMHRVHVRTAQGRLRVEIRRENLRAAQPLITLWTLEICGVPGSTPNSARIGTSVWPNASNSSCDSQMSKTWISPSVSRATWYSRPGGEPAPASSSFLVESSYLATVNELGVKYRPIAIGGSLRCGTPSSQEGRPSTMPLAAALARRAAATR